MISDAVQEAVAILLILLESSKVKEVQFELKHCIVRKIKV